MSDFEFVDRGAGRFDLSGDMSFATAEQILRMSDKLFRQQDDIAVDLAAVRRTDSAGLALLLEWVALSRRRGSSIRFENLPDKLRAIAETAEVEELLA
jgi:phospholipid transport system transporter-binding protein